MNKKGDIWISAVLYFGLGIVVLSIMLAAGLPVINKLRDKNVIIQTKQVMHTLDQNIREVIKEGPGSQRIVTINVKKGVFIIDETNSQVIWMYNNSKILISDPGIPVPEGKIFVRTDNAALKNTYNIMIYTDYNNIVQITKKEGQASTLNGINDLIIRNEGIGNNLIKVSISTTNQ